MELALLDAGLTPDAVTHINAHGTSTPANDLPEAEAIAKVFGLPGPAVTSIKGITGHSLGGAGSMEAAALALTIERALIPPTAGLTEQDPEILIDVVAGGAAPLDPGPGAVELVRLRRPQRHAGDDPPGLDRLARRPRTRVAIRPARPAGSSACPSGEILYQTFASLPFSSTRNAERTMPMYFRP